MACTPSPSKPITTPEAIASQTGILSSSPTTPPESTPTLLPTITLSPSPITTSSPVPFFPDSPTPVSLQICSPLKGYTFAELPVIESQPFIPPRPGKDDGHHGVDFAHWQYKDRVSLEGVDIQSVLPGIVAALLPDKYPYGNAIIIEIPPDLLPASLLKTYQMASTQSLYLLYAHMLEPSSLHVGERVACGETIGVVGNTGASGNPHLHFETRVGVSGSTFESMEYYKTTSTAEERANYESWRFNGDFVLWDPWVLLRLGEDEGK